MASNLGKDKRTVDKEIEFLGHLLRQATGVRSLYVYVGTYGERHIPVFFEHIRLQENVESLWLAGLSPMHSPDLYQLVSKLHKLKELVLNCDLVDRSDEVGNPGPRPRQLETCTFGRNYELSSEKKNGFIAWLLHPGADYAVKHLSLQLCNPQLHVCILANERQAYLRECISRLAMLRLVMYTDPPDEQQAAVNSFLAWGTNIRSLTLRCNFALRIVRLDCPSSLCELEIQLCFHPTYLSNGEDDRFRLRNLEKSDSSAASIVSYWNAQLPSSGQPPQDKRLTIIVADADNDMRLLSASAFSQTSSACREAGILFFFRAQLS